MRKYGIFGILFLSLYLFGAVHTAYAAEEEESLQITQEELLDEFDFSDLDDSLKKMFPREKMTFRDVVETLVSGDLKKAGEQFTGFLFDQFFYELQTHRKLLVYLILIAVIAAVFANFSGAFGERQASEIAFYILYMLLIALCLNGFRLAVSEMEASLNFLLEFMKVLCPTYFLAVTAASGSVTSMFFFEVVLFLIFLAEAVILNFLVPLVNVYMMIQVMGNLTGEEFLSQFASGKTDGLDAKDHAGVCDRDQCRTGNPFSCIGLPETKFCYKNSGGDTGTWKHGRFRDGCRTWNGSSDKKRDWNGRRGDRSGYLHYPDREASSSGVFV